MSLSAKRYHKKGKTKLVGKILQEFKNFIFRLKDLGLAETIHLGPHHHQPEVLPKAIIVDQDFKNGREARYVLIIGNVSQKIRIISDHILEVNLFIQDWCQRNIPTPVA
jgi:hypothetical protein